MNKPNHKEEMQQLSETGWAQMRELLREKGLINDHAEKLPISKKRNWMVLVPALAIFVLMMAHPFKVNDQHAAIRELNNTNNFSSSQLPSTTPSKTNNGFVSEKPVDTRTFSRINTQQQLLHKRIRAQYSGNRTLSEMQERLQLKNLLLQKLIFEKSLSFKNTLPPSDQWINPTIDLRSLPPEPVQPQKSSFSKKIGIFAGAGLNISTSNPISQALMIKNLNVHPGITLILPLTQKWSLHTGIWALSTIHGKGIINKEKELVNNLSSNTYYYLNTTSLIKTSYFDLPLTLHYSINKNWTVGTGLQLSQLYKVNISEEKESYDYNNNRNATTIQQYASAPFGALPTFPKKIDIKKLETRLAMETSFQKNRFLFSGGYYYGLGKPITFKDAVNSSYQYRNQYLKLSVQYRINRKD